jgi:organic hydroperoxide reductase OsmC/OhrA
LSAQAESKRLEFSASIDRTGSLCAEGLESLDPGETWTAEHLLLAALARCTISSLRYHARRAGRDVVADASADGVVTKREEDGRYAFVEIDCRLDVDVDPMPREELDELIAKAERDCFIGASLTAKPRYEWRVNGEPTGGAGGG